MPLQDASIADLMHRHSGIAFVLNNTVTFSLPGAWLPSWTRRQRFLEAAYRTMRQTREMLLKQTSLMTAHLRRCLRAGMLSAFPPKSGLLTAHVYSIYSTRLCQDHLHETLI